MMPAPERLLQILDTPGGRAMLDEAQDRDDDRREAERQAVLDQIDALEAEREQRLAELNAICAQKRDAHNALKPKLDQAAAEWRCASNVLNREATVYNTRIDKLKGKLRRNVPPILADAIFELDYQASRRQAISDMPRDEAAEHQKRLQWARERLDELAMSASVTEVEVVAILRHWAKLPEHRIQRVVDGKPGATWEEICNGID